MTIQVTTVVRHPLWPELGHGEVESISKSVNPGARLVRVAWSTGQVSTHAITALRITDPNAVPTPRPEPEADPRDVLARASRVCSGPGRHSHDHTQCLIEADQVLAALTEAGYRIVALTDVLQEATR